MNARKCTVLSVSAAAVLAVLVFPLGCSKDNPVEPIQPTRPDIGLFVATPADIIPPDTSTLTWKVKGADLLKLFPADTIIRPFDSGQLFVSPSFPTSYSIVAYNSFGKDSAIVSISMSALAAKITQFAISPDSVVLGDTANISWKTVLADSIVINYGIGKVSPTDSGEFEFIPTASQPYRAIAYSAYGNDTAQDLLTVITPTPPVIQSFTATPNDIVSPDSSLLAWKVMSADSLKLYPTGQKLVPADSGQKYVSPTLPTTYSLLAFNRAGSDTANASVSMSALAAKISSLSIEPVSILVGDTAILAWETELADSIVIDNGIGRVSPTDSGNIMVYPSNPRVYTAIAYSIYGNDSRQTSILVNQPPGIRAINGLYYRGVMGSSQMSPALEFGVFDQNNIPLSGQWIDLLVLEGDGLLIPQDSVVTDSMGIADVSYNFSGLMGHGNLRAKYESLDSIDVKLRANTLIPGLGGQAQYIFFSEKLLEVKNFNGNPNSVDIDPNFWINYANYEATLRVVFIIDDTNRDEIAQDSEDVLAIALTNGYTGKTKDSIGIGSTYNDIKAVYGPPDTVIYDPAPPPALVFIYESLGMVFFTNTVVGSPVDTNVTVFEIHMDDFVTRVAPGKITSKNALHITNSPVNYRRFRK